MNAKQELKRLNWNLAGVWSAECLDHISRDPAYFPEPIPSVFARIAAVLAVAAVMIVSAWRKIS